MNEILTNKNKEIEIQREKYAFIFVRLRYGRNQSLVGLLVLFASLKDNYL